MSSNVASGSERRNAIADSGIRIIARDGVRALTHRAVDREAGIPQGSTSYHAKTRLALLELIVDALAARSKADTDELADSLNTTFEPERRLGIDELAAQLAGLVETLASRRDDMRARYALLLELDDAPHLRAKLTAESAVHAIAHQVSASALAAAGLPSSDAHVEELIALTDSLVFYRTAINETASPQGTLTAYLHGIAST
ncbi:MULTISPECIES: TetR/AcrR family transcriptional regulator [Streptomyces]|uniref:TetR family transcriptional regulator n=1 Tax=Streptomyces solicathayae TaxID=3081768 RepID=A0ABZ0LL56_9ACTN|nr:TetR family transcriptional regulator [Streptomyces sp. HUAS YS2]WOX20015.1 TetR family transcriptional regulator [Streptomyces sp. HUAS YS2]